MELSNEDRKAVSDVQIAWTDSEWSTDGSRGMTVLLESICVAGVRAGIERAARLTDDWFPHGNYAARNEADRIAAAIRALLA